MRVRVVSNNIDDTTKEIWEIWNWERVYDQFLRESLVWNFEMLYGFFEFFELEEEEETLFRFFRIS